MVSLKVVRLILVTGLTLAFFSACGGCEEPTAEKPAAAPMGDEPSKQAQQPMKPMRDKAPSQRAEATPKQVEPQGSYARDVMVLPTDVPAYPGAREQVEVYQTVGSSRARRYETSDGPTDVYEFYKKDFERQGWTIDNDANFGGIRMIIASKGSKKASAMISDGEHGGTNMVVTGIEE